MNISLDFDGVLSTLVLGRAWEKTRHKKKPPPFISQFINASKTRLASLTEGYRKPIPHAKDVLRHLRSSHKTLYLLTSRTTERIAPTLSWLEKYSWNGMFERIFFNTESKDADEFKANVIRTQAIDIHIDDDFETLSYLSQQFPQKLFVHMNYYHRKSPKGDNIIVVHSWDEIPHLFFTNNVS